MRVEEEETAAESTERWHSRQEHRRPLSSPSMCQVLCFCGGSGDRLGNSTWQPLLLSWAPEPFLYLPPSHSPHPISAKGQHMSPQKCPSLRVLIRLSSLTKGIRMELHIMGDGTQECSLYQPVPGQGHEPSLQSCPCQETSSERADSRQWGWRWVTSCRFGTSGNTDPDQGEVKAGAIEKPGFPSVLQMSRRMN